MKLNKHLLILFLSLVAGIGFLFTGPTAAKAATAPTVDLKVDNLDADVRLLFWDPMIVSWSSTNADSCFLDYAFGSQDAGPYGNQIIPHVNSHANFTTTLTCTGTGGTATDSVNAQIYPSYNTFVPIGTIAPDWRIPDASLEFNIKVQVSGTTNEGLAMDVAENPSNLSCDQLSYPLTSNSNTTTILGGNAFAYEVKNLKLGTVYCGRVALFTPATGDGSNRTGPFYFSSATTRAAVPVTTLAAAPSSVALGAKSTLTWSATNGATSCTASGDWSGTKAASGSEQTANLLTNKTYSLACTGPGGISAIVSKTVSIAAPTVTLTASSSRVNVGVSVTLSWHAINASACDATPWSAKIAVDDSAVVSPQFTTPYSITCTGPGGSVTAKTTVTVVQNVELSLSAQAVSEADGLVGLTAKLNASSSQVVTIALTYSGTATLGIDYTAPTTISIPIDSPFVTVLITPTNDTALEPDETIVIAATAINANLSWISSQEVTIVSDDKPTVTIVSAGAGTGTFDKALRSSIDYGSSLTISATASEGSTFSSWSGCSQFTPSSCILDTVIANKTVTATFTIKRVTVTVTKEGNGKDSATVSPSLSTTVDYNGTVKLTAVPNGTTFGGWSGGGCLGNNPVCTLSNLRADTPVTATFDSTVAAGDGGVCTLNGKNEVDAYIFCAESFNLNGTNSTFKGAIAAKGMEIDSSTGNSFFYDYDIDGNAPPGFRYLNIPRPTEVGNKQ